MYGFKFNCYLDELRLQMISQNVWHNFGFGVVGNRKFWKGVRGTEKVEEHWNGGTMSCTV
jgi:hypothetical protein